MWHTTVGFVVCLLMGGYPFLVSVPIKVYGESSIYNAMAIFCGGWVAIALSLHQWRLIFVTSGRLVYGAYTRIIPHEIGYTSAV